MVLESLTTPEKAERNPWDLLFIGAMYAAVAVFLSLWIFREEASIVMVLLTVIACVPLMYNTMRYEEAKDLQITSERTLLKEHGRALSFFMCLFVGFVIAFSLAYLFLPSSLVQGELFEAQLRTIQHINSDISEDSNIQSSSVNTGFFFQIFSNNVKVLLFSIFFAFFYGAGAIFILTWNASVISAAIGSYARNLIGDFLGGSGLLEISGYFHAYGLGIGRYFTHGLLEILGYFIGGLAGGIISVAVIQHDIGSNQFRRILADSLDLILLAIFVLVIAGLVEVYVTPALF